MEKNMAGLLLASMLERIEGGQGIGSVSSLERAALRIGIEALGSADLLSPVLTQVIALIKEEQVDTAPPINPPVQLPVQALADEPVVVAPALPNNENAAVLHLPLDLPEPMPSVTLNLTSLKFDAPDSPNLLMCLDFGTAMSKAFAGIAYGRHFELELGAAAGRSGYLLPSSMFIGDNKKLYFGFEALEKSERLGNFKRKRLDSIKSRISQRRDVLADIDSTELTPDENPSAVKLTHGDMIRLYLAYFTDTAELALKKYATTDKPIGRYVRRRYARPCWPDANQVKVADAKMRQMMEQAQILADTFSGQWQGGIDVRCLKSALQQVKELSKLPGYLVDAGIPEPVAVAGGVIYDSKNVRDAYMVVDVGAGTTDFGLFISTRKDADDVKVFQVGASIQGMMQAGDKVDSLLRGFITQKERIDSNDTHGDEVIADLARRIRSLKEILFTTGKLEYVLSDSTTGKVTKAEFLTDSRVQRFAQAIEDGFTSALANVSDSWLKWLSSSPMCLQVVVTGGSAKLDMMQKLSSGIVDVRGYKIQRVALDHQPSWLEDAPEALRAIYPQMAVAIGGTSEEMPETLDAPTHLLR